MSIGEFMEARIAEDEALAKVVDANWPAPWRVERGELLHSGPLSGYDRPYITNSDGTYADEHFARYDPARVLAECAAKRAIIEFADQVETMDYQIMNEWGGGLEGTGDSIVKALAAVYADHPDYQQEWAS